MTIDKFGVRKVMVTHKLIRAYTFVSLLQAIYIHEQIDRIFGQLSDTVRMGEEDSVFAKSLIHRSSRLGAV